MICDLAAANARADANEKDAGRYKALFDLEEFAVRGWSEELGEYRWYDEKASADAAIDAARKEGMSKIEESGIMNNIAAPHAVCGATPPPVSPVPSKVELAGGVSFCAPSAAPISGPFHEWWARATTPVDGEPPINAPTHIDTWNAALEEAARVLRQHQNGFVHGLTAREYAAIGECVDIVLALKESGHESGKNGPKAKP